MVMELEIFVFVLPSALLAEDLHRVALFTDPCHLTLDQQTVAIAANENFLVVGSFTDY